MTPQEIAKRLELPESWVYVSADGTMGLSIYGWRVLAYRTGLYLGGQAPSYQEDEMGIKCSVSVWIRDPQNKEGPDRFTVSDIAYLEEYQNLADPWWQEMPLNKLAFIAEGKAIRKAFPLLTLATEGSLYVLEEVPRTATPTTPSRGEDWLTGVVRSVADGLQAGRLRTWTVTLETQHGPEVLKLASAALLSTLVKGQKVSVQVNKGRIVQAEVEP